MLTIRKAGERGRFDHGWLDTSHSFSFASYYDPRHMGFRSLRVINEDFVKPGYGFGTHGHSDMEIITYVVEGALEHKDSLGTGSIIRPGDVQRMTAGTGVRHSEFNPSKEEPVHLLQIWILPERDGLEPSYEQRAFGDDLKRDRLQVVASRDGRDGSVTINQDASVYASILEPGARLEHELGDGRGAWLQIVRGAVRDTGHRAAAGDGVAVENEERITLEGEEPAELLLFDLA
jgi:redox-sensitive bicupin YhaK (pirin superfamily)